MSNAYYTKETITKKLRTMREVVLAYKDEIEADLELVGTGALYPNIYKVCGILCILEPAIYNYHADEESFMEFVVTTLLEDESFNNRINNIDDEYIQGVIDTAGRMPIYHEEITHDKFTEALPDYGYDEESIKCIIENFIVQDNEKITLGYLLVDKAGIISQVNTEGCCNVSVISLQDVQFMWQNK